MSEIARERELWIFDRAAYDLMQLSKLFYLLLLRFVRDNIYVAWTWGSVPDTDMLIFFLVLSYIWGTIFPYPFPNMCRIRVVDTY